MIGERPESRSSNASSKNSFKISPRLDGADLEMMHYKIAGDLNFVDDDRAISALNDFAPSMPKNLSAQYSTPTEKSALR